MGLLVTENAWLPDRDGEFRAPEEMGLEDLPDGFAKDEGLAEALGMRASDVTLLADRLGFRSEDVDFWVRHRDEFEEFKRQIQESQRTSRPDVDRDGLEDSEPDPDLDYAGELEAAFTRPGGDRGADPPLAPGPVDSLELRRERTQVEIEASKREEPQPKQRFVRVSQKVWEKNDLAVRTFLLEQYDGACQICTQSFPKRDGEPYFEGLYLVHSTSARWVNRAGNVLCLCATCCAKFQHGAVEAEDVLEQVMGFRAYREGGGEDTVLRLKLCGESVEIRFSERHMIDLQEMVKDHHVDTPVP